MLTRREWLAAAAATAAPMPELCTRSAVELAALLRANKASAREVLDAHLKRIEDTTLYKRRNEVERLFRPLKGFRRIFSRSEELDVMFLGFVHFTLIADALR